MAKQEGVTAKGVLKVLLLFVCAGLAIFAITYYGFGMKRYWMPKHENLRREVFENTKSYVIGKTQDLAGYYGQYSAAKSEDDRQIIAEQIKVQFADFDAGKINSTKLRNFLTNTRGY